MRDLGTPVYAKSWFEKLASGLGERCKIAIVYLQGKPVAAGFLVQHGDTIEIPWASSVRWANKYSVNMLLYWQVLEYSIESGAKYFDFGRCDKDSNTYRFKKQWGAEEKQLYWLQYEKNDSQNQLNPKNDKFSAMIKMWQKLPLAIANLIGPFIVKNIP